MNHFRLLILAGATLIVGGCGGGRSLDETGGLRVARSACPAVAIPAYTGDVAVFSPVQSQDARALDVTATITNLQKSCDETGPVVRTQATFDVVARRANPRGSRDLVLPYFSTVLRGGTRIMSKQIGQVQVHFDDGQVRGLGRGGASADVDKGLSALPAAVMEKINRKRKPGDADAAVDPMTEPGVREAVSNANFELLIGFQLTQAQLAYNATR